MIEKVTVNRKGATRINNGHLWIYKSDVIDASATGGEIVSVFDDRKRFLGKAFYSDKSEITLRFVTTKDEQVDKEFWRTKLKNAQLRRENKIVKRSDSYRMVFSEGDLMPSLIIDRYTNIFVIQTLSQGSDKLKEMFVEILREEYNPIAIVERNEVKVREFEGLELKSGVLFGDCPDEVIIQQDNIKFYVSPIGGQKTGAFLDQRENRYAMRNYAHGKALDCFTFNGGFALNLSKVCDKVTAVDVSEDAVKSGERNAELNDFDNIEFKAANVFDVLSEKENARERFDTIVLDPPAFAKNRASVKAALRGYKEINLRALKMLNKNGVLATCTCSFHASESLFVEIITEAARDAKRRVQIIEKRSQSSDHPILLGMPETHYLKCLILRVLE